MQNRTEGNARVQERPSPDHPTGTIWIKHKPLHCFNGEKLKDTETKRKSGTRVRSADAALL